MSACIDRPKADHLIRSAIPVKNTVLNNGPDFKFDKTSGQTLRVVELGGIEPPTSTMPL